MDLSHADNVALGRDRAAGVDAAQVAGLGRAAVSALSSWENQKGKMT
jgi:hypothetical protein